MTMAPEVPASTVPRESALPLRKLIARPAPLARAEKVPTRCRCVPSQSRVTSAAGAVEAFTMRESARMRPESVTAPFASSAATPAVSTSARSKSVASRYWMAGEVPAGVRPSARYTPSETVTKSWSAEAMRICCCAPAAVETLTESAVPESAAPGLKSSVES